MVARGKGQGEMGRSSLESVNFSYKMNPFWRSNV